MTKRRNKQAIKAIDILNLTLPDILSEYLTDDQKTLLKCVLANYTIEDMVRFTSFKRACVIEELVGLGRSLAMYELMECKIFPKNVPSAEYLKAWNDCKNLIRGFIHGKVWRQTIKDRNIPTSRTMSRIISERENTTSDQQDTEC